MGPHHNVCSRLYSPVYFLVDEVKHRVAQVGLQSCLLVGGEIGSGILSVLSVLLLLTFELSVLRKGDNKGKDVFVVTFIIGGWGGG